MQGLRQKFPKLATNDEMSDRIGARVPTCDALRMAWAIKALDRAVPGPRFDYDAFDAKVLTDRLDRLEKGRSA